jgi:hypothetical protein
MGLKGSFSKLNLCSACNEKKSSEIHKTGLKSVCPKCSILRNIDDFVNDQECAFCFAIKHKMSSSTNVFSRTSTSSLKKKLRHPQEKQNHNYTRKDPPFVSLDSQTRLRCSHCKKFNTKYFFNSETVCKTCYKNIINTIEEKSKNKKECPKCHKNRCSRDFVYSHICSFCYAYDQQNSKTSGLGETSSKVALYTCRNCGHKDRPNYFRNSSLCITCADRLNSGSHEIRRPGYIHKAQGMTRK